MKHNIFKIIDIIIVGLGLSTMVIVLACAVMVELKHVEATHAIKHTTH
jgi:hypothetical protein